MPATQEAGIFDESALVAKAREGDLTAFNELVNTYSRKIFRLAKHITQNDEDAEDVLQETFLKAFEHLSGFQGQSKFYTWIVRIAVNESLMKLRKRKSDRSVPLDEPVDTGEDTVVREIAVWEENPEQKYSREELGQILDEAVEGLRPAFLQTERGRRFCLHVRSSFWNSTIISMRPGTSTCAAGLSRTSPSARIVL